MNLADGAEMVRVFRGRFGVGYKVPKSQLKKISNEMARSLWSMGIPICYDDGMSYIVACGINPFSFPKRSFFAWVDEGQDSGSAS